MPHVLLLRFVAPMQSWGVASRFSRRDTGKEPSKSGVIGLLCAALGIERDEANVDNPVFANLNALKMGVRVNRRGVLQSDYHTAQNVVRADGSKPPEGDTKLSTRFYLSDADFLVGLEGDDSEFLQTLQHALENPRWQIFLGRKAFVPSLPVFYKNGVLPNAKLRAALETFDLQIVADNETRVRLILETDAGSETRQDVPLSFAARRFASRRVATDFFDSTKGEKQDDAIPAV